LKPHIEPILEDFGVHTHELEMEPLFMEMGTLLMAINRLRTAVPNGGPRMESY
jgi:hypothetical protein